MNKNIIMEIKIKEKDNKENLDEYYQNKTKEKIIEIMNVSGWEDVCIENQREIKFGFFSNSDLFLKFGVFLSLFDNIIFYNITSKGLTLELRGFYGWSYFYEKIKNISSISYKIKKEI